MTTHAVVLVGGLGARLRPLTFAIPKPLLPVGERSILELLLGRLAGCGFRSVTLATGYHAELIRAFCGDGSRFGVSVSYVHESKPLGTAGPLSMLGPVAADDDVLLVNGDIVTDFDFRELPRFRRGGGYDIAVAFIRQVDECPFGVLALDGPDVVGIVEKPSLERTVSAGMYALGAGVLAHVPDETFVTVPQVIQSVLAAGGRVGAVEVTGAWQSIEDETDLARYGTDE